MTRGYRNNNPGNIRKTSTVWMGQIIPGSDADFITFESMEWGYRAIFVLLDGYISKGFDTISKIINRYAPSSENDTTAYINHVSTLTGINQNTIINPDDMESMIKIVAAISYHENGTAPNFTQVNGGWDLLGKTETAKEVVKTIGISITALIFVSALGYLVYEFIKSKAI